MKKNKKNTYKYAWGGEVDPNMLSSASMMGGNLLASAVGQNTDAGGFFSGAGSGAGLGASIGSIVPGIGTGIGAIAGGLIGGVGGLIGASNKQEQLKKAQAAQKLSTDKTRYNNFNSNLDTINDNPYGNLVFAKGGEVPFENINIEKGELQIDPSTGKILREYIGMNPETGGTYKPHSKGKDTQNNFVTAEPGTFIITKKMSKDYKSSLDNNDLIRRNTILQNIKNAKTNFNTNKMALGSFVDPTKPPYLNAINPTLGSNTMGMLNTPFGLPQFPNVSTNSGVLTPRLNGGLQGGISATRLPNNQEKENPGFGKALDSIMGYAPALLNIGQGLFGNVDQTPQAQAIANPYLNNILNNMPQDISLNPLLNRINRNQRTQFRQIDNTTSSNPIARANKNNVFGNTQNQFADLFFQQQSANNQIRGQRSNIYSGLGSQQMQEAARVQQLNLGIDQQNQANRAAKTNLFNTGIGQLQQTYQNQRLNTQQRDNDKLRTNLLFEMFPNLRFYQETFGGQ